MAPELTASLQITRLIRPRSFGGVGFHCFDHLHSCPGDHYDNVIKKRWRELNPSFARLTDTVDLTPEKLAWLAANIRRLRDETQTSVYLTTWDPPDTAPGADRAAYARRVVDRLEHLYRHEGLDNLRWYCMTNELSLNGWGLLRHDLPKFADYHAEIFRELRHRDLPIGLLATDASPTCFWNTLDWARANMDDISAAYGGHDYFNAFSPEKPGAYSYFLEQIRRASALAPNKPFIIGEFGAAQFKGERYGIKNWDGCKWFNTELEPWVGLQLAEAIAAAINGGAYAIGYWTFADFPDPQGTDYANKWGTFRWSCDDTSVRSTYNALGPLTRFFRGPATVLKITGESPSTFAAAVTQRQELSILVINRAASPVSLKLALPTSSTTPSSWSEKPFRRFLYDPRTVRTSPFGDLPDHDGLLLARDGQLSDELNAESFAVYTTAYADENLNPIIGVRQSAHPEAGTTLLWDSDPKAIYYRIFDGQVQVGSTIATEWSSRGSAPSETGRYSVSPVDRDGNCSALR